jgi:hypothetical protein
MSELNPYDLSGMRKAAKEHSARRVAGDTMKTENDGAGARELPQRIKELFNLSENDGAGVPLVNTCPVCRPYAKKGYQELSDGRTVPCYACNRAEFVKQAVAERGEVGSPFKELAKGPHLDTAAIHEDGTVTHHPAKLMKLKPEVGSVGQGERDEIRKSMDSLVNAVPDSICKSGTAMHEGRSQSRLDNDRLASVEVGTDTCSWALSDCTRAATHITGKGILLCADHAKVYGAREKVFPLAYVSPSAQPEAGAVTPQLPVIREWLTTQTQEWRKEPDNILNEPGVINFVAQLILSYELSKASVAPSVEELDEAAQKIDAHYRKHFLGQGPAGHGCVNVHAEVVVEIIRAALERKQSQ